MTEFKIQYRVIHGGVDIGYLDFDEFHGWHFVPECSTLGAILLSAVTKRVLAENKACGFKLDKDTPFIRWTLTDAD